MVEKIPMTIEGFHKLEAELKELKSKERPAIIRAIEEARGHGDLSENAEYHAAKEKQGFVEARITDLESQVARAEVIDPRDLSGNRVMFACTVTVADEDDRQARYKIVGAHEADVKDGRISYTSPLGKALIGRTVGDEVEVITPGGDKYYEVINIEFI